MGKLNLSDCSYMQYFHSDAAYVPSSSVYVTTLSH